MATEKRLIDANALLEMGRARKIIEVVGNWKELPGCAKSACVRLGVAHKKMILDAPTVDAVEVVHGRWIEKQEPIPWCEDDVEVYTVCSICDCYSPGESNYCPNCGAKMDGDGNA